MTGLYLDLDTDCFISSEPMLAGRDVVLQADLGNTTLSTAALASVSGHPLVRSSKTVSATCMLDSCLTLCCFWLPEVGFVVQWS